MRRRMWLGSRAAALAGVLLASVLAVAYWRSGHRDVPQAAPRVGTIDARQIPEGSGIVASRRYKGVYWTHSDSGNDAALYAISRDGRILGKFPVAAPNDDWEDIAADSEGHLYIAATGNNSHRRQKVAVLRMDEPDPHGPAALVRPDHAWELSFPESPLNCEGMFVYRGRAYLVSKVPAGEHAAVYTFALDTGATRVALERWATLSMASEVTAADISPDGHRVAILSTKELCLYDVHGDIDRLRDATPARIPLRVPNDLEGCCFAPHGILVTGECGEMYLLGQQAMRVAALHPLDRK